MKSKLFLLGAAVVAFTFNTFAADALLSPRAAGNQIQVVPGISAGRPGSTGASFVAPRAGDSQIKSVAGVLYDANPSLACRNNMNGTPKAVGECTSHSTMPGCLTVAAK